MQDLRVHEGHRRAPLFLFHLPPSALPVADPEFPCTNTYGHLQSFESLQAGFEKLAEYAEGFDSQSTAALLRSAPDLTSYLENIRSLYKWDKEEGTLLPVRGADDDYEEILKEIGEIEDELEALREGYVESLRTRNVEFWHSAQGQKEIYQIQGPSDTHMLAL